MVCFIMIDADAGMLANECFAHTMLYRNHLAWREYTFIAFCFGGLEQCG
jgi:hypothetical protein